MQLYIVAYLSFFENQIHTAMIAAESDVQAGIKFLTDREHLEISQETWPYGYEYSAEGLDRFLADMDATITVKYYQDV